MTLPGNPQRSLWIVRLYFLFFLGGGGLIYPFLNLFYVERGLSGAQIGILSAVGSVIALTAAPALSARIDRTGRLRQGLQVFLIVSAVLLALQGMQTLFIGFLLIVTLRSLLNSPVGPLSDRLALTTANAAQAGYGSIRLFGSLGWAFLAVAGGWLVERGGFFTGFAGSGLTLALAAILLFALPRRMQPASPQEQKQAVLPQVSRFALPRDPTLIGLAFMLAVIGLLNSGVLQFEPVFMSQLGASETLLGLASTLGAAVEIPAMLLADRLKLRYSAHRILMAGILLYVLMRGLVLLAPSVAMILVVRAIGGFGFSFYLVGLINLIGERSEEDQVARWLAFYTVTLASLINMTSAPLTGLAFDLFGAYWLYALSLAGYLIGFVILFFSRPNRPRASVGG